MTSPAGPGPGRRKARSETKKSEVELYSCRSDTKNEDFISHGGVHLKLHTEINK
jgi:hypothetical protein